MKQEVSLKRWVSINVLIYDSNSEEMQRIIFLEIAYFPPIYWLWSLLIPRDTNRIGGVMVNMLASSAVD